MRNRIALLAILLSLALCQSLWSQDHVELGAFANYFRLSDINHHNFAGIGGRLSASASPHLQMEGELAYDFEQVFAEAFENTSTGVVAFQKSPVRVLHGLFGPKFHTGEGPWRAFFVLKGGFINFRFDDRPATFGTFISSVEDLRSDNTRPVLYPGGGLEGFWGPFGMRLEFGDEIYFLNGSHNNLRIAFGPMLRF